MFGDHPITHYTDWLASELFDRIIIVGILVAMLFVQISLMSQVDASGYEPIAPAYEFFAFALWLYFLKPFAQVCYWVRETHTGKAGLAGIAVWLAYQLAVSGGLA